MGAEVERYYHSGAWHTALGLVLHKEYKNAWGKYQNAKFFATGTLIHPRVVLTAAHCLKDTLSVSVTMEETIPANLDSITMVSRRLVSHPNYETSELRLDFGLIFLPKEFEGPGKGLPLPVLESYSEKLPDTYIRYGYGGRDGVNRRFRTEMKYSIETKTGFILSEDSTGVYGDSGGPVYVAHENKLRLIGIHTGREKDSGTRSLKDRSFMTPLTPALILWIQEAIRAHSAA